MKAERAKIKPIYLEDDAIVKNPFSIVTALGNFTVSQMNIVMTLVANIQDRINNAVSGKASGNAQLSLFTEDEFLEGKIQFAISMKDLGVNPRDYGDLEEACRRMSTTYVKMYKTDKGRVTYSAPKPLMTCWMPETYKAANGEELQFKNGKRRTGRIVVEMDKDMCNAYMTIREGYTKQLYKLARKCKKSKTFPIYSMMCRYKDSGKGVCELPFQDFKEKIGLLNYKPGTKLVSDEKYEQWKDFRKRVMEPSREELKKLFDEGKVDFYFDYIPVYNNRAERGNPDVIRLEPVFTDVQTAVEVKEEKRKNTYGKFLTGSSKSDALLFQRLLETGNEWAKAYQFKPFGVEDFAREVQKEGLEYGAGE